MKIYWQDVKYSPQSSFSKYLSINGFASQFVTQEHNIKGDLSPFCSVIDVPSSINDQVSIFYTSFRDLVLDPIRSNMHQANGSKGHRILADKCLKCLNMSLQRNSWHLADMLSSRPMKSMSVSFQRPTICMHLLGVSS